jgi:pyrroloquinoline quinone (PQQ) biosynthesis protein C
VSILKFLAIYKPSRVALNYHVVECLDFCFQLCSRREERFMYIDFMCDYFDLILSFLHAFVDNLNCRFPGIYILE